MHILKIIHGYPPDYNAGSEVYSQSICEELSQYHQITIFTREENPYLPHNSLRFEQINPHLCKYVINRQIDKDRFNDEELNKTFENLLSQLNPDLVHIGHLNHLSTGIVKLVKKAQIPIVFTLHDFWLMCPRGQFIKRNIHSSPDYDLCGQQIDKVCAQDCYSCYFTGESSQQNADIEHWERWVNTRMKATKAVVELVDLFIAPSRYLLERFLGFGVQKERIIYLDYGFPTHYLQPTQPDAAQNTFTFGYIGTHIPAKGINYLIEAFAKVEKPCQLLIWGRENGQSTRYLRQLAAQSRQPVHFMGEYVNKNLRDEVFSRVNCIVVPSIWGENSPLVIHEAQSCRVPVITADAGGMSEYVQHLQNGLLFAHRDKESLYQQLNFAVHNPELLQKLGKRGYLYHEKGLVPNIQTHCQELLQIYTQLINKKTPLNTHHSLSTTHRLPSSDTDKFWRITLDTNPEDCNLRCTMCEEHSPHSTFIADLHARTGFRRRRMPFSTVQRLFEEAKLLGVSEIIPSTMGEPLLYKDFDLLLELYSKHNLRCNLTTNGTFPKKSVVEWAALIVPVTSDVKISWNAATPATAQAVMLDIDFHKAVENVRQFIRVRDEYFAETGYYCRVTFQLTFMRNNMHELADIIKLAAALGVDRVKGHHLWAHFEQIQTLSFRQNIHTIREWNAYVQAAHEAAETFRRADGSKLLLEQITFLSEQETEEVLPELNCPFLGKELWISAEGNISPCCAPDHLRQSLGNFGNINQTTLQEVINSDLYKNLQQNYKQIPLCKSCNMRK